MLKDRGTKITECTRMWFAAAITSSLLKQI